MAEKLSPWCKKAKIAMIQKDMLIHFVSFKWSCGITSNQKKNK